VQIFKIKNCGVKIETSNYIIYLALVLSLKRYYNKSNGLKGEKRFWVLEKTL
jgi:hypothetical protein